MSDHIRNLRAARQAATASNEHTAGQPDAIVVTVAGGNVQGVDGIPPGAVVEIRDYDEGEGVDRSLSDEQLAERGLARDDDGEIYGTAIHSP